MGASIEANADWVGAGPVLAGPAGADWKLRIQANFLFRAERRGYHFSVGCHIA